MNNTAGKLLSISDAASYLGVSQATLRRWDDDGSFKATFHSPGGHRYYSLSDLEKRTKGIFRLAQEWVSTPDPREPESDFYCSTSERFKTRLERMAHELNIGGSRQGAGSLISSATGEIGNNSFDHNLGTWPDTIGIFFAYDPGKHRVVLADRGQGVLCTLRRIRPELKNEEEALRVAFTEFITGRAPEHRGNGLKYVVKALEQARAYLFFQSGDAVLEIRKPTYRLTIKKVDLSIKGCLALIEF